MRSNDARRWSVSNPRCLKFSYWRVKFTYTTNSIFYKLRPLPLIFLYFLFIPLPATRISFQFCCLNPNNNYSNFLNALSTLCLFFRSIIMKVAVFGEFENATNIFNSIWAIMNKKNIDILIGWIHWRLSGSAGKKILLHPDRILKKVPRGKRSWIVTLN